MNTGQKQRNPVLLVHGIWDTGKVFRKMSSYLKQQGRDVYDVDLVPNNGDAALEQLAQQLANHIKSNFNSSRALDLVGFSMGGIVSRYYIQRLGGIKRVQKFITISSPHYGTRIAYLSQRPGAKQMRPGSRFLKDLNHDMSILKQVDYTSIWTPLDMMIVPANSSKMPIGKQIVIPVLLHAWMLVDSRILAAVAEVLNGD
ncbi:MAG: alpha/beta hydrolase [Mastigocoleus sp. MO_167.B18]|nr:alpha/beta hydrolase [Mastigocoleus sp. MO_167.B18]